MATKTNKKTNVPNLRFPGFEEDWKEVKFSEVGVFFKGSGISKYQLSDNGSPCILYGELYTKYKNEVIKEVISKTSLPTKGLVKSQRNDIIIPSSGESAEDIATACCIDLDDILIGGDLNVIRPYKDNGIFISYQLNGKRKFEIAKIAQGSSVVHLYNEGLKKISVNLPVDLEEQNKIATLLSLIDDRIQTQNKIIEALKSLKSTLVDGLLQDDDEAQILKFKEFSATVQKHKLADICTFFSGGTPKTSNKEFYTGTIPFMRSGEINLEKTELFISEAGFKNSSSKMVKKGDLLIALYGATSGESAISKIDGAINQAILCVRSNQNQQFLKISWEKAIKKTLSTYLQGGQGNLSLEIIKKLEFYFPSKEEQNKITRFFDLIESRVAVSEKSINLFQKQKQFLLKHLFI